MSESKKTAEAEETATAKETTAGFCAYVGPTIPRCIQNGMILHGDKETALTNAMVKMAVEKYPGIAALIVDGNDLGRALKDVKIEGTKLFKAAADVFKK